MEIMTSSSGNNSTRKTRVRGATNFNNARSNTVKKLTNNRNHHGLNAKNQRTCVIRSNSLRNNINNKNNGMQIVRQEMKHDTNGNSFPRNMNAIGRGKFTREVYQAISHRLGHTPHIPGDSVQALFNDMKLYPSKQEVSEMLQIARQVGRRNGTHQYLTFGEFCFFTSEMQNPQIARKTQSHNKPNKCTNNCEVFLGGSCNPTTWRTDTAIPELQKHGITYYNPQVSMWAPELVAQEHEAKQSASLLLYVVDSQTRSVAGMIEVAYLVAAGRCVVLVAYPYKQGQHIMGEPITDTEYLDLVNGQTSLLALVKSQGIKVHNNLPMALQTTANILRNTTLNNGMTAEEQLTHKLRKLRDAFDSFDANHTEEINLSHVLDAYQRLTNKSIDMHSLSSYLGITNNGGVGGGDDNVRISFEQFCALVAEFSSEGCESFTTKSPNIDGTFTNITYWTSALLKTRHLLTLYVQRPFTHFIGWITHPNPMQRQCATNNNSHYISENHLIKNQRNGITNLIYLGGSCNSNTSWRQHIIPLLKKQGISYYNPAVREIENCVNNSSVCESSVLLWKRAMDKSKVLLFYVTMDTRSLTTMILAAHYIGLNRDVILCIEQLPVDDDFQIDSEKLTKQAIKDYNRGRVYLADLAKRKQVPVFDNITETTLYAIERCRHQNR